MSTQQIWPGTPYPLGATWDGSGTNFSIFSQVAEKIELCIFDVDGYERRYPLPEVSGSVWHGYLKGVGPGTFYGFRVHGPYNPHAGQRCNPHKLLMDPYAKAIHGEVSWHPSVYGAVAGDPDGPMDTQDSAPFVPRSVVTHPYFDWNGDHAPKVPFHKSVIYEMHVKGFTAMHPEIPPELRGTYAGLAHPVAIRHLKLLGVTAVELLPVHHFVHDHRLVRMGLRNYWGYNTLGFFAPHHGYSADRSPGGQVHEFKTMVRALHREGIEVILDVVYNHTAETDHTGPTLSFRGIDNQSYYHLNASMPQRYTDFTGCGNSMLMRSSHVLQLLMDSLRYWVLEMRVDGFRFDLASTLARELHAVNMLGTFFHVIQQDPVLSQVKLIAEPWDVGEGGYQVGNFPPQWSEWNGKYRDCVRDFWRGEEETIGEFASRFTGSSDLYEDDGRRPFASINFVTAHDGYSMRDLVTYEKKYNLANGEENRDGENHNRSWNCGVEGETDDPEVNAIRARQQKNMLATLLFSQGVPMILMGDEVSKTQRGNNNTYCQDNELSWLDWSSGDTELLQFVRTLIRLRRMHPVFQRRGWFKGGSIRGDHLHDIGWFRPDGIEMNDEDWQVHFARSLGVFLNGDGIDATDMRGTPLHDDSFYFMLNAGRGPLTFVLPPVLSGQWLQVFDTAADDPGEGGAFSPGMRLTLPPHAMRLLRRPRRSSTSVSDESLHTLPPLGDV